MPTVVELRAALKAAGLSTSGRKAEMIARLDAYSAAPAATQSSATDDASNNDDNNQSDDESSPESSPESSEDNASDDDASSSPSSSDVEEEEQNGAAAAEPHKVAAADQPLAEKRDSSEEKKTTSTTQHFLRGVLVFVAALVAQRLLIPPEAFPNRLTVLSEAQTAIDNDYYGLPGFVEGWWSDKGAAANGVGLLHLLNTARIPYFMQHLDALKERRKASGVRATALTFVDVGCGGGIATEPLAQLGYNFTGIDASPGAVAAASKHARASGLDESRVRYEVGSAYDLSRFADDSVDGVVCSDVLEHLHDVATAVKEIRRILKPGGVFLFDTINRTWLSYVVTIVGAQELLGYVPKHTHDHRMYITPAEMRRVLSDAGFDAALDKDDAAIFKGMRPSIHPDQLLWNWRGGWQNFRWRFLPGFLHNFVLCDSLQMNYLGFATVSN
jgi:ubiquinone biosynthesis O-methyltransferase